MREIIEVRCKKCGKLLGTAIKGQNFEINIKCTRCKDTRTYKVL